MRILFTCSVKFSEKMLLKLISIQTEIVGVITLQKSAFITLRRNQSGYLATEAFELVYQRK